MVFLKYALLVAEVVLGLLLICVVLLQKSKDQGIGLAFGSGMGESLFGARTGNVMLKTTIVLAVLFFLCTIALAAIFARAETTSAVMGDVRDALPPPQPTGQQP